VGVVLEGEEAIAFRGGIAGKRRAVLRNVDDLSEPKRMGRVRLEYMRGVRVLAIDPAVPAAH